MFVFCFFLMLHCSVSKFLNWYFQTMAIVRTLGNRFAWTVTQFRNLSYHTSYFMEPSWNQSIRGTKVSPRRDSDLLLIIAAAVQLMLQFSSPSVPKGECGSMVDLSVSLSQQNQVFNDTHFRNPITIDTHFRNKNTFSTQAIRAFKTATRCQNFCARSQQQSSCSNIAANFLPQ